VLAISHRARVAGRSVLVVVVMAALGVLSAAPADARSRLHVSVSPARADVGKRACFGFLVTDSGGRRVSRADVLFAGRTLMGGRSGRARVCTRLRWPGRHFATAFKIGYDQANVFVRAVSSGLPRASGGWHQFVTDITAYGDDGRCRTSDSYGEGRGLCSGPIHHGTAPFQGQRPGGAAFFWERGSRLSVRLSNTLNPGPNDNLIVGWSPSGASGALYVIDGSLPELKEQPRGITSGTDPGRQGQPGGPLHIDVTSHGYAPLPGSGYTMGVDGYLFY
jgi:hypothetical protein